MIYPAWKGLKKLTEKTFLLVIYLSLKYFEKPKEKSFTGVLVVKPCWQKTDGENLIVGNLS